MFKSMFLCFVHMGHVQILCMRFVLLGFFFVPFANGDCC